MYHLFVNGIPKPQPRPRTAANGHVYNPHTADAWKEDVKAAFLPCLKPTITGPVRLTVRFSLPMPKGMKITGAAAPHVKKPDADNLLKAVMDSLTAVCVWKDDAQVFETLAGKYYTGEKTGAQIIIEVF
jgi:Holliday junction resolvase RusA-like endonuclease